ncbi:unnamed protein product [Toxocara canis]|uniref:ShKT domain-containing protein n=1 Tax=Toxocara canis TaxID=6265 RepID=A0A183UVV2_TOXCA|nr:unnamed protein product [Toxocara canis]
MTLLFAPELYKNAGQPTNNAQEAQSRNPAVPEFQTRRETAGESTVTFPDRSECGHYQEEQYDPPSPCFLYGPWHRAKECYFVNRTCNDCKLVGHEKGYCKNFA